jgi:hypothetical protein
VKISIISSLYRSEKHLRSWSKRLKILAIKLELAKIDFEVIAISNDPTLLERNELESLNKFPWFNVTFVPRESIYATWNRGIEQAKGEICTFWNVDDDRNLSGFVSGIKEFGQGAKIVYFPYIYLRYIVVFGLPLLVKVKKYSPPKFDRQKFSKAMYVGPFFMFLKELALKDGAFDPSFEVAGDFEWCTRMAQTTVFTQSKVVAGIFRNDGTTLSGSRSARHKQEILTVLAKY